MTERDDSTRLDSTESYGDTAPDDFEAGRRLGDFELIGELGRGGMGVVYEAHQVSLNRRVALKVLPPSLGFGRQAARRFQREAQAAAKLHHTNVVSVHAIGESEGHHYYAMELVDGQSLDRILKTTIDQGGHPLMEAVISTVTADAPTGATTSGEGKTASSLSDTTTTGRGWFNAVAKLVAEAADGLHYAHGQGIVHRDIKPANLMLSDKGTLCITDFGLAHIQEEPGLTLTGSFLGTPAYMSPEQIAAGRVPVDHRTDVYSLGAVLYEMLTMRRPFPGRTRDEVLAAVMAKDPRAPRKFNRKIPVDLETICLKALEKDPDRRYQDAGAMAQDLRHFLHGGLITARRAALPRRIWKSMRRHPAVTTAAVAAVIVALLGWGAWSALQQARVPQLVSEARLLLEQGEYVRGLALADRALAIDADNIAARLVRVRTHFQQRHFSEAREEAETILAAEAENWEAHMLFAAMARHLPTIDAETHVTAVEGRMPDTADALYLRGLLAGSNRDAIDWLNQALDSNPAHLLALGERTDRYVSAANLPAAMSDAEKIRTLRPRSAMGHYRMASVFSAFHDERSALEACDRAIDSDPEDPLGYFHRARVKSDRGDVDGAIEDITQAIDLDDRVAAFHDLRSELWREKRDHQRAIEDAQRGKTINRDSPDGYLQLARSFWDAGRRDEARQQVQDLAARTAGWNDRRSVIRALEGIARFYIETGAPKKALVEAEKLVQLSPGDMVGYRWRAAARNNLEGSSAIERDCDTMAALELDEPRELIARAEALSAECGRPEIAVEDYSKAVDMSPSWADAYQGRGRLLRREKRFDEARLDFEQAIRYAPSWSEAHFGIAGVDFDEKRFEEALAGYSEAVRLGMRGHRPTWARALTLFRLHREREAIAVVDDYLERNVRDETMRRRRARLLYWNGQLDQAVRQLDDIIDQQPDDAGLHYDRASYLALQRDADCRRIDEDLTTFQNLQPDGPVLWTRLAYLHAGHLHRACPEMYDGPRALTLARKAVNTSPRNTSLQSTLAVAAYRSGSFQEAIQALRDATRRTKPSSTTAPHQYFFLAMALSADGDSGEARDWYDRAVETMKAIHPNNPELVLIRAEASEALGISR